MRAGRLLTALLMASMVLTGAGPAAAGDTTTTFAVLAGGLSITVPAAATLGSGEPGTPSAAQLGTVTVVDDRAAVAASWTATVSCSDFTTGGATPAETISKSSMSYWSGPATASTGVGEFLPGQVDATAAQTLAASRTAFTLTVGTGNNSASWNPTLVVTIPAAAVAGTYTGTVTHSVA